MCDQWYIGPHALESYKCGQEGNAGFVKRKNRVVNYLSFEFEFEA